MEFNDRATHEVVRDADSKSVYQGMGQQCADYLFEHKGRGIFVRPINKN